MGTKKARLIWTLLKDIWLKFVPSFVPSICWIARDAGFAFFLQHGCPEPCPPVQSLSSLCKWLRSCNQQQRWPLQKILQEPKMLISQFLSACKCFCTNCNGNCRNGKNMWCKTYFSPKYDLWNTNSVKAQIQVRVLDCILRVFNINDVQVLCLISVISVFYICI